MRLVSYNPSKYHVLIFLFSRTEHGLNDTAEISSAIKHNPFSGQRRINPQLSFMPYLCKKCTNGFSNKDNCIKHLIHQHGVTAATVLHHIATNKRLSEQPSYFAGMKDAQALIKNASNVMQQRGQPRVGSGHSAFIRPMMTTQNATAINPSIFGNAPATSQQSTYITSPPIMPIVVKKEAAGGDDQPLDFSMKRESQSRDLSPAKRSATKPEVTVMSVGGGAGDVPMDLSCKSGSAVSHDNATSRVAPHNVTSSMSSSMSCHSELPPPIHVNVRPPINAFLPSTAQMGQQPVVPMAPIPLVANAAVRITGDSIHNNATGSSFASILSLKHPPPIAMQEAAVAGIPTPRLVTPLVTTPSQSNQSHAPSLNPASSQHLQHFYVPALHKFQCAHCRLLFKNSSQV